jgi:hypothetical protein
MMNRSQARSDLCRGYSGVLTSVKMRCSRRTHYHRSFSLFLRPNERCILSKAVLERECRISVKANGQPVILSASALSQTEIFFRDRNAIYGYLAVVFDLVMWWAAEDRAITRARWTLRLQGVDLPIIDEPFAAVILCTADRKKVDKRTRSKWSRALRYAAKYKTSAEPLAAFVLRKGGINQCAERFTRYLKRAN